MIPRELRLVNIATCSDGNLYGISVSGSAYRFDRERLAWVPLPMRVDDAITPLRKERS